MTTRLGAWCALLLLVAVSLGPPPIAAADGVADEADLAFRLGAERYRQSDYEGALQQFLLSNRLVPNRNVMYNIARAFERLGRFPDAYRWYLDARDGETREATLAEIDASLERIRPNVAILDITSTPPGATVFIDRRDLGSVARTPRPIALSPGQYRVLVELDGYEPAQSEMLTAEANTTTPVTFELTRIVGQVAVEGDEGTTVHVESASAEPTCTVPCTLDLPPGGHVLHFRRAGFRIAPQQVTVTARQTSRVLAESEPLTGSLVVTADERDALVEVDGRPMGFTPAVLPSVPVGTRQVRVTLRGYEPVEREVEVREGAQADLRGLSLVPTREITAASRLPERIEDAPTSVSVITSQELEAFQYPTIYEALRGTRGMALSFDSTYSNIAVRGLGQPNDYGNRLLILSDGAVLNDNILYQSFSGFDGRSDLGDVQRIEVVRGPGSVLYGTGAVSGVVNLVTRPRDEPTSVHASIGTYDTVARARVGGNLRLGDDSGFWASAAGARSDGRDIVLPVIADGGGTTPTDIRRVDAFRAATFAARAWHKSLTAQLFFNLREQEIPTGAFGTRLNDPGTVWTDTRGLAEVRFEPKLSDDVQLLTRAYANIALFDGVYLYDGEDEGDVTRNVERYVGRWYGAEARIVARFGERLRLSAGGELLISDHASLEGGEGDDTYLDENKPYQTGAGYLLAEWNATRWLRAVAGARVDVFSTFGASLNPRLALILRPSANDVVKLMGGRAFRAPSIYELLYNDAGLTQVRADFGGNELQPETVLSAEVEYSHRFSTDWVALASGHFQYADAFIETVRVDPNDDESPIYYRNADVGVVTLGGDLEVRREWRSGIMMSATYGYLVAQYTDTIEGAATDSRRVVSAPSHFASVRGVVPLGVAGASLASRLTLEAPRRIGLESNAQTDAAVIADLVLTGNVREHGVKWAVGVYNLFDWQYDVPVTETFASRRMPQIGRSFLANLTLTL